MRLERICLGLAVAGALVPATAGAATGDLTQLADPFGCHFFSQTDSSSCQATTALHQPEAITTSADGKSVYVAVAQSEAVVHFQRDPATGRLEQPSDPSGCISETGSGPCGNGEHLLFAVAVAVSPDGKNVYAGSANGGGVAILDRDVDTGLLSQRTAGTLGCVTATGSSGECVSATGIQNVRDLAISPNGKQVYVVGDNAIVTLNRDTTTGNLTPALTSECFNEFGDGGCVNGKALWDVRGVTVSPDGRSVYTANAGADDVDPGMAIFDRDLDSGVLTQTGCITQEGSGGECTDGREVDVAFAVAVSPDNKSVYLPVRDGSIAIFDRDTTTRAVTQKAGTAGCITQSTFSATNTPCALGHALPSPTDAVVSPDGKSVYMSSQDIGGVDIFDRDPDTGGLVQRAAPAGCIASAAFYITNSFCAAAKSMTTAWGLTIDPDGRNVYVAAHTADRVGILAREGGTPVTPTPIPTPTPGGGSPAPTPLPSPPVRLAPTFPPPRIRTVSVSVRNGNVTVTADAPGAGTVTVTADGTVVVSARTARAAKKVKSKKVKLRIAKASRKVTKAGKVKLVLKPTGKAKALLRRRGKLKATLTVTFKPVSGKATTARKAVTFKYKR